MESGGEGNSELERAREGHDVHSRRNSLQNRGGVQLLGWALNGTRAAFRSRFA